MGDRSILNAKMAPLRPFLAGGVLLASLGLSVWFIGGPDNSSPSSKRSFPAVASHNTMSAVEQSGRALRVLVVGDSVAGSLAVGLAQEANRFHAVVVNEGHPGCSVGMDGKLKVLFWQLPPGDPCVLDHPEVLLETWKSWVAAWDPDVVLYIARGDLFEQEINGSWGLPGQPKFDAWLHKRFVSASKVLTSRGAHLLLATPPVSNSAVASDGSHVAEDDPARVEVVDRILRASATTSQGASVIDLGARFSPNREFAKTLDSVTIRCADGVHFTRAAGSLSASLVFNQAWKLGGAHRKNAPEVTTWPGHRPPSTPGWYRRLVC
jgi:hypothetical protein